jgi:hypothetical protein
VEVLPQSFKPTEAPHVAHHFLDQDDVAELAEGGSARLLGQFALLGMFLRGHAQMSLDFLVQFLFTLVSVK